MAFPEGKHKISQGILTTFKSQIVGMKKSFGKAIKKYRIVSQSRRRKTITLVKVGKLASQHSMTNALSILTEFDGSCLKNRRYL